MNIVRKQHGCMSMPKFVKSPPGHLCHFTDICKST
nr:MAG TPA: hypothetical protein [Caudoviricetes sp.]